MAKVFQSQFNKGLLREKYSGNSFTCAATAALIRTGKGMAMNLPQVNGYAYITLPSVFTNIGTTNFSIAFYCKINTTDRTWIQTVFEANNGEFNFVTLWLSSYKFELTVCDANGAAYSKRSTDTYEHDKWYHIMITWTAATNTPALYVNGVLNDTAGTGTNGGGVVNLTLGSRTTYNWQSSANCTIGDMTVYDTILTEKERIKLYNDFLQSFPISEYNNPRYGSWNKPTVLSQTGLVAAYNMIPSAGGILTNLTGNGNDGTIDKCYGTKDGMLFNGSGDVVMSSAWTLGTAQTFCMRLKPIFTTDTVSLIGDNNSSNNLIGTYFSTSAKGLFTINGVNYITSTQIFVSNQFQDVIIVRNETSVKFYRDGVFIEEKTLAGGDNVALNVLDVIGSRNGGLFFKGIIENVKIYNIALSQTQITNYHNSFVRPVLVENFLDDPVGSALPKKWIKGTGTYTLNELSANDSVLKEVKIGMKYLSCSVAGTVALPSKTAYGTWEFALYKGGGANLSEIIFISDKLKNRISGVVNIYTFLFSSTEGISFLKNYSTVLFYTADSHITINTWYQVKITRTKLGVFTVYIKGGVFGNVYTLVSVTGGSGTNPVTDNTYTTSEYMVLDFDANDRISIINILDGIKQ